jgi:type 1 fimbria pilin
MNTYKLACILTSISFLLFTNIPLSSGATGSVIHIVGMVVEGSCTINNS